MFYSPVQDLQRPTHPRLRIRDTRDAQIVLEAVRIGFLQPVERRLNENERNMFIRSGAVFVWEESDNEYGLKRWTDGRMWTPSRAREPFLFYEEKITPGDPIRAAGSYRFVEMSPQGQPTSMSYAQYERSDPVRPMGLIKQAYSSWTVDPATGVKRKWHITAYSTKSDWNDLPVPAEDPSLAKIKVPSGVYQVGKPKPKESHKPGEEHHHHHHPHHHKAAYMPRHSLDNSMFNFQGQQSTSHPYYDERFPEDQRVIQMLNSQHII